MIISKASSDWKKMVGSTFLVMGFIAHSHKFGGYKTNSHTAKKSNYGLNPVFLVTRSEVKQLIFVQYLVWSQIEIFYLSLFSLKLKLSLSSLSVSFFYILLFPIFLTFFSLSVCYLCCSHSYSSLITLTFTLSLTHSLFLSFVLKRLHIFCYLSTLIYTHTRIYAHTYINLHTHHTHTLHTHTHSTHTHTHSTHTHTQSLFDPNSWCEQVHSNVFSHPQLRIDVHHAEERLELLNAEVLSFVFFRAKSR